MDRLIDDTYVLMRIKDPVRKIQAATGSMGHLLTEDGDQSYGVE